MNIKENTPLREKMIQKGLECASQYSWKNTADETVEYIMSHLK